MSDSRRFIVRTASGFAWKQGDDGPLRTLRQRGPLPPSSNDPVQWSDGIPQFAPPVVALSVNAEGKMSISAEMIAGNQELVYVPEEVAMLLFIQHRIDDTSIVRGWDVECPQLMFLTLKQKMLIELKNLVGEYPIQPQHSWLFKGDSK